MTIAKSNIRSLAAALCVSFFLALPVSAQDEVEDDAALTTDPAPAADEEPGDISDNSSEPDLTTDPAPEGATAGANSRRVTSFSDAIQAAGADGIAVFCYGPNWNRRSVQMLKNFWNTSELEQATGSAVLLAVPYYENPTDDQRAATRSAAGGMSGPPFGVCPTVMLFDANGTKYANLAGTDFLGSEADEYKTGYENLRKYIGYLHKRDELMKQAESTPAGVEKAKLLNQVAELPINAPSGLVQLIREADPDDQSGMVRRNTFNARDFLYEQMGTKDGFLSPDFEVDFKSLEEACLKVAKDETLKPRDRQAAYLLLIGASRRNGITGHKLKALVAACAKIAPQSDYGKLSPFLSDKWASLKSNPTSEDRRNQRRADREKNKDRRNKEKEERKAAKNSEVR